MRGTIIWSAVALLLIVSLCNVVDRFAATPYEAAAACAPGDAVAYHWRRQSVVCETGGLKLVVER
jgi:hypothetical protein